jgi:hypothetical protein
MGIFEFYINVKMQNQNMQMTESVIQSDHIYKDYINYYIDAESSELCLQAAIVCFFPTCEIIYDLCCKINKVNPIVTVTSRKISRPFDFTDSSDFLCWMHRTWKERLEGFNKEWGAFLVNREGYYKSRRKLNKKYYISFSLDGKSSEE